MGLSWQILSSEIYVQLENKPINLIKHQLTIDLIK